MFEAEHTVQEDSEEDGCCEDLELVGYLKYQMSNCKCLCMCAHALVRFARCFIEQRYAPCEKKHSQESDALEQKTKHMHTGT